MRRSTWLTSVAAALLLASSVLVVSSPAAAQEDGAKKVRKKKAGGDRQKGARKKRLPGEYGIMASVLKIEEPQLAKFNEAVKAYSEAMKAWQAGPDGAKLAELQKAMQEARKAKDKDKAKELGQELKPLMQKRMQVQTEEKARIMAVLTPEQKTTWAGFTVFRSAMGRYKRLKLTKEQEQQVRDLCDAAAKTMPPSSDRKAYGQARKELDASIVEKVLKPEQKEQLKQKPEKGDRQPRDKKPREKRAGKGKAKVDSVITE
jgi:Spy/CpxP family protein refolding chaperone